MKNETLKRQFQAFAFFVGWMLSPLTAWNDSFVNIPLAYFMANFVYIFAPLSFRRLFIGSYIFTNILGFTLMFVSGKEYVFTAKSKIKAAISLIVNIAIFSALIILLDKSGRLAPLL